MGRNFKRRYSNNGSRSRNKRRPSKSSKINPSKYVSKSVQIEQEDHNAYQGSDFQTHGLSEHLLNNLRKKGFEKTTKIQELSIPLIAEGKDILGISATGSGKTGAFLIPIINKIYSSENEKMLIIAPTRELAQQILKEGISIVKGSRIRLELVIGGEKMGRQISKLKANPEIVVGTPGRLLDLVKRGHLKLKDFNNIVIDEVDRMLDMGFINDIKKIYNSTSNNKQSLFFSATMDRQIESIISSLSRSYETIKLEGNKPAENVYQDVVYYNNIGHKVEQLLNILSKKEVNKTLVFVETKRFADVVARDLSSKGINSGVLHGDKSQNKRKSIIKAYKYSKFDTLVATNVAARGLDIDDITHVINLDEPRTYDEYIHRIGRTGRNGKVGTAYTFVQR